LSAIHVNRGGYSTVYEVTSKATNERCAVKCIEKRILEKGRNIKLLRRYCPTTRQCLELLLVVEG
jgi:serine/threonine protein kinase